MALPKLETSTYSIKIPSTGIEVEYRPYVVKEEKILMIALESKDSDQIMKAVKNIIFTCTFQKIDVDTLAPVDLEYLFLKLRAKSVGETSRIKTPCKECKTLNEVDINIDDVVVPEYSTSEKVINLTKTVGMTIRQPSISSIMKHGEKTTSTDIIAECIVNIFTEEEVFDAKITPRDELLDFIEQLSSKQLGSIKDYFSEVPKLEKLVEFQCTSCGKPQELNIQGLQNFF